jgi:hypothetical protein
MNSSLHIPVAQQLSAAARFYHLLSQIQEDRKFLAEAPELNRIIYVLDTDVVNMYVDPYQDMSCRYMRLFEPRSTKRIPDKTKSSLYATARLATEDLYVGKFRESILFPLPTYRNQLLEMIGYFATAKTNEIIEAIVTKGAQARSAIAVALEQSSEEQILAKFRENAPYFLLSAITDDGPLDRIEKILDHLLVINQGFMSGIGQPEPDSLWKSLHSKLLSFKKHQIEEYGRGKSQLNQNIEEDVDVVTQILELNQQYNSSGIRFYFLTGDYYIHRVIDAVFLKGDLAQHEWPAFNFVRRPVQMTRFMQEDCLEYFDDNKLGKDLPQAFEQILFLRHRRGELYDAIYDEKFKWDLKHYENREPLGRILQYRLDQVEKDILESRNAALALQAKHFGETYGELKDSLLGDRKLMEIVQRGLDRHLSRVQALLQMAPEGNLRALNDLLPLLFSFSSDQHQKLRHRGRSWHRLQSIPKFPDSVFEALRAIIEPVEPEDARDRAKIARMISRIDPGWLFLFSAYLSALLGNWAEAVQQCLKALEYAERLGRPKEEIAEFSYFLAVSFRHTVDPGAENLAAGLRKLDGAIEISREPRYLVERAAYGLAIPYHQKFYKTYESAIKLAPSPAETLQLLVEAERLADEQDVYNDLHITSLCFRAQLYCNFCSVYLYSTYLNKKCFRLDETISDEELNRYCGALGAWIEKRGGDESVSGIVRFIFYATKAHLLRGAETPSAKADLAGWKKRIEGLLRQLDAAENANGGIIASDRRKLEDMVHIVEGW